MKLVTSLFHAYRTHISLCAFSPAILGVKNRVVYRIDSRFPEFIPRITQAAEIPLQKVHSVLAHEKSRS